MFIAKKPSKVSRNVLRSLVLVNCKSCKFSFLTITFRCYTQKIFAIQLFIIVANDVLYID